MATATAELQTDPLRVIEEALEALDEDQRRLDRQRAILETSRRDLLATYRENPQPTLSVGATYLAEVEAYLRERGKARQANIVDDLGLNSGTVSVSLRKLELDGKVEKGEKERGSRVWVHANPAGHAADPDPGIGARESRIAA